MTSKFNPVEHEFKDPAHAIDSFAIAAYICDCDRKESLTFSVVDI
jgi:hypothetical protein